MQNKAMDSKCRVTELLLGGVQGPHGETGEGKTMGGGARLLWWTKSRVVEWPPDQYQCFHYNEVQIKMKASRPPHEINPVLLATSPNYISAGSIVLSLC